MIGAGGSNCVLGSTNVDHTGVVNESLASAGSRDDHTAPKQPGVTAGPASAAPTAQVNIDSYAAVRQAMQAAGLSPQVALIMEQSCQARTKAQYKTCLEKWWNFCVGENVNILSAPVNIVLGFLAQLYNTGLGKSAINTAQSALSTIIIFDNKPLVARFLKRVL